MILANKLNTAKEIFSRVASMYELLPDFIKPGVKEYNKTSMTFAKAEKSKRDWIRSKPKSGV